MSEKNPDHKQNLLNQITEAAKNKLISKKELLDAYFKGTGVVLDESKPSNSFDFSKVLNFLGGGIVLFGIIFLVGIYWSDLGGIGQVIVTFGSGVGAFILAIFLHLKLQRKYISGGFHLIAGFLIPTGIFVWLSKLPSSDIKFSLILAGVFSILALIYIITDKFIKSNLLTLFYTFYSSVAFWSLLTFLIERIDQDIVSRFRIPQLTGVLFSIILILLGVLYKKIERIKAGKTVFNFGVLCILGFIFSLVIDYNWAEALYAFVLIGSVYFATTIKSSLMLSISVLYILIYIFYINTRYFVNVVGWPISLIVGGLAIIGLSYFAVDLNKRFIKK